MIFDRLNLDITATEHEKTVHVSEKTLSLLASEAFDRISFTFTRDHLEHLVSIVNTKKNSDNDRRVASLLLENAVIASKGRYPLCQDTGIAQVFAWKDNTISTETDDIISLSEGIEKTYKTRNLRFSTTIPSSLFDEYDPQNNMPAQILISATQAKNNATAAYRFLFCAKGGGSANKTKLIQGTKALLTEKAFTEFLQKEITALGTAACPPYLIAVVVGGLSSEQNLLALKLATAGYFDTELEGWEYRVMGTIPLREREWEKKVLSIAAETGLGAQFGGTELAVQACVLRLPRHGASCPVSIGVSCSAHRNLHAYIDSTGIYLEKTEQEPLEVPGVTDAIAFSHAVENNTISIDLNLGITHVKAHLSGLKTGTNVLLSGKILVARDAAHARWHSLITEGKDIPSYTNQYAIFYAGPAQTPPQCITGSFGPTTAGRMDEYAEELMSRGAAIISMAKGNRSEVWRKACLTYGGTYLGIIGGAAALIAEKFIIDSTILDYSDLGMEAVRLITVSNLPAIILINDQGEDFYTTLKGAHSWQ